MSSLAKKLVITFVAILLVCAGALAYYMGGEQREHLIKGVPYWGIYTGTEMNSSHAFAVYTLLQYWGDNRFTPLEIAQLFPSELSGSGEVTIGDFFRDNGYNVENITSNTASQISEYIEKDIPLIAPLRLTPTDSQDTATYRVVFGYSNKKDALTVHDNLYGNNLEISYEEYGRMRFNMAPLIVVTPSEELKASLTGPDTSLEYPARKESMDSESMQKIVTKWFQINSLREEYNKTGNPTGNAIAELGEAILSEPDFDKLHPAARVQISLLIARLYYGQLNNYERAREILTNVTTPLIGTDFSQPFGDWDRKISPEVYKRPMWTSEPWIQLGIVHERLGDIEAARAAYQKAVEANPDDLNAQAQLQSLE